MTKIAIVGCKKIQDQLCIACAKCLKAVSKKDGNFAQIDDDIELVALTNCGDCPGLIMPKYGLVNGTLKSLENEADMVFLGTCIQKAVESADCPMDPEKVKKMMKNSFGVDVAVGTHQY